MRTVYTDCESARAHAALAAAAHKPFAAESTLKATSSTSAALGNEASASKVSARSVSLCHGTASGSKLANANCNADDLAKHLQGKTKVQSESIDEQPSLIPAVSVQPQASIDAASKLAASLSADLSICVEKAHTIAAQNDAWLDGANACYVHRCAKCALLLVGKDSGILALVLQCCSNQ